jgi:thymidylate synthase
MIRTHTQSAIHLGHGLSGFQQSDQLLDIIHLQVQSGGANNLYRTKMKQYIDLVNRIVDTGTWVNNARTGKRCLTVINADLEYDLSKGFPVLTTKRVAWKSAIAEILGYLRGYNSAKQFRDAGTKTWDANANSNAEWLKNRFRTGTDDMGRAYGVQGRSWTNSRLLQTDQLANVINDLANHVDNRREIVTFWNPGEIDQMALPACMHTHTFSILDDTLYLTSYQRSADVPLGLAFNSVQVAWLLAVVAQITNLKPGIAYHKIVNAHIYEDQLGPLQDQVERTPYALPQLKINPAIKTLEDLETWVTVNDFELVGYQSHPAVSFAFAV